MCRLVGYAGEDAFNPLLLKLLGLYADNNGGDGAGIAYVDKDTRELILEKGAPYKTPTVFKNINLSLLYNYKDIGTQFELLTQEVDLDFVYTNAILLHARRATIGEISVEFSQPFLIEGTERTIIGMHNGTIINYDSFGIPGSSDSKIILTLIADGRESELKDIQGDCALMWIDLKDPDSIYVFSHKGTNKSEKLLHYLLYKNNFYFSSEYFPLSIVQGLLSTPYQYVGSPRKVSPDVIWKFNKQGMHKVQTITRPVLDFSKEITKLTFNTNHHQKTQDGLVMLQTDVEPKSKKYVQYYRGKHWLNETPISTYYSINDDGEFDYQSNWLFTSEGQPLIWDGTNYIYSNGIHYKGPSDDVYELYFHEGILFKDRFKFESFIQTQSFPIGNVTSFKGYVQYPINLTVLRPIPTSYYFFDPSTNKEILNISFMPVFSKKEYVIRNGYLIDIVPFSFKISHREWKKHLSHEISQLS